MIDYSFSIYFAGKIADEQIVFFLKTEIMYKGF